MFLELFWPLMLLRFRIGLRTVTGRKVAEVFPTADIHQFEIFFSSTLSNGSMSYAMVLVVQLFNVCKKY
jgi:hypothetical protein